MCLQYSDIRHISLSSALCVYVSWVGGVCFGCNLSWVRVCAHTHTCFRKVADWDAEIPLGRGLGQGAGHLSNNLLSFCLCLYVVMGVCVHVYVCVSVHHTCVLSPLQTRK